MDNMSGLVFSVAILALLVSFASSLRTSSDERQHLCRLYWDQATSIVRTICAVGLCWLRVFLVFVWHLLSA